MSRPQRLPDALLFIIGVLAGCVLAAIVSLAWRSPENLRTASITGVLFLAAALALFATLPAVIFGLPALSYLRRKNHPPWVAAAALALGGGVVGGLIMFALNRFRRFDLFAELGLIVGAFVGLALGLIFFAFRDSRA